MSGFFMQKKEKEKNTMKKKIIELRAEEVKALE